MTTIPAIRERPLMFTHNVPKLIDGTKTQTRRLIRHPDGRVPTGVQFRSATIHDALFSFAEGEPCTIACPQGEPGDRLWIKEAYRNHDRKAGLRTYLYRADYQPDDPQQTWAWNTPMYMPREASRLLVTIGSIRIERVQAISEADALAEGVEKSDGVILDHFYQTGETKTGYSAMGAGTFPTARAAFELIWNSINAKRGFDWKLNPLVWAITFFEE